MRSAHVFTGLILCVTPLTSGVGPSTGTMDDPIYSEAVKLTVEAGTLEVPTDGDNPSLKITSATDVVLSSNKNSGSVRASFTPTRSGAATSGSGDGVTPINAAPGDLIITGSTGLDGALRPQGATATVPGGAHATLPTESATSHSATPSTTTNTTAPKLTPNEQAVAAAADALHAVSGEQAGMQAVTSLLDTGARTPSPSAAAGATSVPVIVLHGFMSNSIGMLPTILELKAQGFKVYSLDYGKPSPSLLGLVPFINGLGPVDKSAAQLAAKIAQVKYETGASKVNLVGGSEGGLIIREYMDHDKDDNVANVVEYSGAHNGTTLSGVTNLVNALPKPINNAIRSVFGFILGPAGPQLASGSKFLAERGPATTKPGVNYLEFSSKDDFVVTPYKSSYYKASPGSTVIDVETHSVPGSIPFLNSFHSMSLADPATNKIVGNFLKSSNVNPPTAEQIARNPGTTITVDQGKVTIDQGDKQVAKIDGVTKPSPFTRAGTKPVPSLPSLSTPGSAPSEATAAGNKADVKQTTKSQPAATQSAIAATSTEKPTALPEKDAKALGSAETTKTTDTGKTGSTPSKAADTTRTGDAAKANTSPAKTADTTNTSMSPRKVGETAKTSGVGTSTTGTSNTLSRAGASTNQSQRTADHTVSSKTSGPAANSTSKTQSAGSASAGDKSAHSTATKTDSGSHKKAS